MSRNDPYTTALLHRITILEKQLNERPTSAQVEYVSDRARRQKRLYESVLARNIVLKRRLAEATAK